MAHTHTSLTNPSAATMAQYMAAAQQAQSAPNGHSVQGTQPVYVLTPEDVATFQPQEPGQPPNAAPNMIRGKSQADRTFNGLKKAGGEMAWTTLWSMLAIKGTVFCCGLLGWPFVIPAVLSGGKAIRKFKEGYNAD